jgi:uncharacterized protein (TIGR03435 family)
MTGLAGYLQTLLGEVVVDKTGLTANYDFKLTWARDQAPGAVDAAPEAPSLFTAIEETLGLRLEPAKAPFEVFVIDNAEKLSEN